MVDSFVSLVGNLVLPYVVLSAFAMLLVELIAHGFDMRAKILQHCIRRMLTNNSSDTELMESVYSHPLVQSLSAAGHKPSYIPADLFATVVVDQLETNVVENQEKLRSRLQPLLRRARPGTEALVVHKWFLQVMDQASGLYRWRTHLMLIGVAIGLVVSLNFDAIRMSNQFANRRVLEKLLEASVKSLANKDPAILTKPADSAQLLAPTLKPSLMLGWPAEFQSGDFVRLMHEGRVVDWALLEVVGLFTSVLALMLGAPILFDVLNKFTIIRLTVKPY